MQDGSRWSNFFSKFPPSTKDKRERKVMDMLQWSKTFQYITANTRVAILPAAFGRSRTRIGTVSIYAYLKQTSARTDGYAPTINIFCYITTNTTAATLTTLGQRGKELMETAR